MYLASLSRHWQIDPSQSSAISCQLNQALHRGLFFKNHKFSQPQTDLAASVRLSDDQRCWRFRLKPARFANGNAITLQHLLASLQAVVSPGSDSLFHEVLAPVFSPDDVVLDQANAEVRLHLAYPYPSLPDYLAHPALALFDHESGCGAGPMQVDASAADPVSADYQRIRLITNPYYDGTRHLAAMLELRLYADWPSLSAALHEHDMREQGVIVCERHHQLRLAATGLFHSTPACDDWRSILIANAAGSLADVRLRQEFFALLSAHLELSLGAQRTRQFVPEHLLSKTIEPRNTLPAASSAGDFVQRWQAHFQRQPLRVLYAAERGVITSALDVVLSMMDDLGLAYQKIATHKVSEVYEYVARGDFDLVARGWMQDVDDLAQYAAAHQKQAPEDLAQAPYQRFYRDLAKAYQHDQSAVALCWQALEQQHLYLPLAQDYQRLYHGSKVQLQELTRHPFDLS